MKIFEYEGKKNICGKRIRQARKALRLSQSELAAQLQIRNVILERDTISRIEIGDRFVADFVRAISEALKVDVAWLLNIEKEDT